MIKNSKVVDGEKFILGGHDGQISGNDLKQIERIRGEVFEIREIQSQIYSPLKRCIRRFKETLPEQQLRLREPQKVRDLPPDT